MTTVLVAESRNKVAVHATKSTSVELVPSTNAVEPLPRNTTIEYVWVSNAMLVPIVISED